MATGTFSDGTLTSLARQNTKESFKIYELVWCKYESKWWPARIIKPHPKFVKQLGRRYNEDKFVVRFFGDHKMCFMA
jgi:hypothetical protein